MASRLDLQTTLETILDSENVYYRPPETLKMQYPCIRYSKSSIQSRFADNTTYSATNRYELIVISKTPDHEVISKLLELPYASYDRNYVSDNLNHDVITIYY